MPYAGPFVGSDFSADDFDSICLLLREEDGFDLSHYKESCIKRRIAARVRELGYPEPAPYIERLRSDRKELHTLREALAIHVSRFYRDVSTFTALRERFLPELALQARKRADRTLRIWSAGCAGGEEPYSLALMTAQLPELAVSILGSDVSDEVLTRARGGRFDEWHLGDIPVAERQRHFTREGRAYRLVQTVRDLVDFETFDLLGDTPYPKADLILCRYVMIYFAAADQEEVARRFAAALTDGGLLVLGRTEVLRDPGGRFRAIDMAERIYRKVG